ncbi:hypothetical protein BT93_F0812 [Corymbia citriodora subsp. variegata]|nr:hypothetical protein BT93_F0812 [Corymbia citriodora subsp. variegata]
MRINLLGRPRFGESHFCNHVKSSVDALSNPSIAVPSLSIQLLQLHSCRCSKSTQTCACDCKCERAREREEMKCFQFTNGERRDEGDGVVSRASKVLWACSLNVASSTVDSRRFKLDFNSKTLATPWPSTSCSPSAAPTICRSSPSPSSNRPPEG